MPFFLLQAFDALDQEAQAIIGGVGHGMLRSVKWAALAAIRRGK
jgi:hypothetical protein